jgi:sugar/nucleoside kinase (ribokinase family)
VAYVLIVGELNVDLVLQNCQGLPAAGQEVLAEDFLLTLGSASAICAAGLARLGDDVAIVSKVGGDAWGEFCVDRLRDAGVDVRGVMTDARLKTGVTVSISGPADRALVTVPGATRGLTLQDLVGLRFDGHGHLHVSSYFLQTGLRPGCAELFRRATAAGWTTSLDPGFDPAEEWGPDLRETLRLVDVFFPNDVELRALGGTADPIGAIRALDNGRTLIVAKLGCRGCMALDDGEPIGVAPPHVATLDTTGAGDSFNAGFLHAWLRGDALRVCLRTASACGALSTRAIGGTTSQPSLAELDACLETFA